MGDDALSYLGYSYGTHIGATYATLFPRRVRALVLDGAVDVEGYSAPDPGHPAPDGRTTRMRSTASSPLAGSGDHAGWEHRRRAGWQALVKRLDRRSISASGAAGRPPVDGDDLRVATFGTLNQKSTWPVPAISGRPSCRCR